MCSAKCVKTSLPHYHMYVQAKGEESSPSRGSRGLFAVLTGDVEEGGKLNSSELLGRGRRLGKVAEGSGALVGDCSRSWELSIISKICVVVCG